MDAIKDFTSLRKMCTKGRKKATTKALEDECLRLLKIAKGKNEVNALEERRKRRRLKQSSTATEDDTMVNELFDFELDEDDDDSATSETPAGSSEGQPIDEDADGQDGQEKSDKNPAKNGEGGTPASDDSDSEDEE